MEPNTQVTDVVFRADRKKTLDNWRNQVTAVFPALPGTNEYDCTCYAHNGQHGSCSFGWYRTTRPATEAKYEPLMRELQAIGYNLRVVRRVTPAHHKARIEEMVRMRKGVA